MSSDVDRAWSAVPISAKFDVGETSSRKLLSGHRHDARPVRADRIIHDALRTGARSNHAASFRNREQHRAGGLGLHEAAGALHLPLAGQLLCGFLDASGQNVDEVDRRGWPPRSGGSWARLRLVSDVIRGNGRGGQPSSSRLTLGEFSALASLVMEPWDSGLAGGVPPEGDEPVEGTDRGAAEPVLVLVADLDREREPGQGCRSRAPRSGVPIPPHQSQPE